MAVCVGNVNEPKCNEKLCKTYSVQRDRCAVKKSNMSIGLWRRSKQVKKRADDSMEEREVPDNENLDDTK